MDTSFASSMYLVPHWKERLLEDYEDEGTNTVKDTFVDVLILQGERLTASGSHEKIVDGADVWPVKLLEREARKGVWGMCSLIGVDANGVPGMACQLLERYLAAHFREHASSASVQEDWEDYKRALALRIPLLMASCIQLAAKMNCTGFLVTPNLVRSCLLCKGLDYSLADVKSSEYQVFRTLGYRVPLWTSVETAQLLAVEVGMPGSMTSGVAMVVNLVEYRRDHLNARVRAIANVSPVCDTDLNKNTVRTLHLVAGAVLATARYLGFKGQDPATCLGSCTRAPVHYIKCICDVILAEIIVNDAEYENHTYAKRRRN